MSPLSLVTLTAPPAIEEALVDWLLQSTTHMGFSSYPVNGHSSRTDGLSLAEQVAGRKKQIRFQMHIATGEVSGFISNLKQDFAGTGIHYWITAISEMGHI